MNAVEAIREATAVGIQIAIDGNDLLLEAAGPPPMTVIELLSRHKPDIVNLLRSGDGSLADALAALERKCARLCRRGAVATVHRERSTVLTKLGSSGRGSRMDGQRSIWTTPAAYRAASVLSAALPVR